MPVQVEVKVDSSPSNALALTNQVFFHSQDANILIAGTTESSTKEKNYAKIQHLVYTFRANDKIIPGSVGLSSLQRQNLNLAINDKVTATLFIPEANSFLSTMRLEVDLLAKKQESHRKIRSGWTEKIYSDSIGATNIHHWAEVCFGFPWKQYCL